MSGNKADLGGYDEGSYQRTIPELGDLLRPRNLAGWFFGFLERFFFSRNYAALLLASPFVVLAIGGPAFVWWLKDAPRTDTVAAYKQAVVDADARGDTEAVGIYLAGLVRLRPADKLFRFNHAMHLINNEEKEQGLKALRPLTATGPLGYNKARLWFAQQHLEEERLVPVSAAEHEAALLAVLKDDSRNLDASRMLSDYYLRTNQLKAAEDRLEQIVEHLPALNYTLVVVKKGLGRQPDQYKKYLINGISYFRQRLVQEPNDQQSRILLAKSLVLGNRTEDAERILREGIAARDTPELRQALTDMLMELAQKLIAETPANRNKTAMILTQALHWRPDAVEVAVNLMALQEQDSDVPEGAYDASIEYLQNQESRSLQQDIALSRMLTITGQHDDAASLLADSPHRCHQTEIVRAKAMYRAGNIEASLSVVDALIEDFAARESSLSPTDVAIYSNCFALKKQFDDARRVVKQAMPRIIESYDVENMTNAEKREAAVQTRLMQQALSRACIAQYDQLLKDESFEDAEKAMGLLGEALATNTNGAFVVDRLAEQIVGDGRFSAIADEFINRMLANGVANSQIYNMLGLKALQLENYDRARVLLDRSLSLDRSNPVVLNNLALAIVRGESVSRKDAQRALGLANEVLDLVPGNKDALSTRGEVLIALERWEEARADLESSISKTKDNPVTRGLLVKVFTALGEPGIAKQHQLILDKLLAEGKDGDT